MRELTAPLKKALVRKGGANNLTESKDENWVGAQAPNKDKLMLVLVFFGLCYLVRV